MQKFSACRNRPSDIQRFSSTRMRCITAICPAGPPKLSSATRAQTRAASEKLMLWTDGETLGATEGGVVSDDVILFLTPLWLASYGARQPHSGSKRITHRRSQSPSEAAHDRRHR